MAGHHLLLWIQLCVIFGSFSFDFVIAEVMLLNRGAWTFRDPTIACCSGPLFRKIIFVFLPSLFLVFILSLSYPVPALVLWVSPVSVSFLRSLSLSFFVSVSLCLSLSPSQVKRKLDLDSDHQYVSTTRTSLGKAPPSTPAPPRGMPPEEHVHRNPHLQPHRRTPPRTHPPSCTDAWMHPRDAKWISVPYWQIK